MAQDHRDKGGKKTFNAGVALNDAKFIEFLNSNNALFKADLDGMSPEDEPQLEKTYNLFKRKEKAMAEVRNFIQNEVDADLLGTDVRVTFDDSDFECIDIKLSEYVATGDEGEIEGVLADLAAYRKAKKEFRDMEKTYKDVRAQVEAKKIRLEEIKSATERRGRSVPFTDARKAYKQALADLKAEFNNATEEKLVPLLKEVSGKLENLNKMQKLKDQFEGIKIRIFELGNAQVSTLDKVRTSVNAKMSEYMNPGFAPGGARATEAYSLFKTLDKVAERTGGDVDYLGAQTRNNFSEPILQTKAGDEITTKILQELANLPVGSQGAYGKLKQKLIDLTKKEPELVELARQVLESKMNDTSIGRVKRIMLGQLVAGIDQGKL